VATESYWGNCRQFPLNPLSISRCNYW
jgi:hypothetical protein